MPPRRSSAMVAALQPERRYRRISLLGAGRGRRAGGWVRSGADAGCAGSIAWRSPRCRSPSIGFSAVRSIRNGRPAVPSCLKRLPTRSATRSTIRCSNTSISLRPWLRKWVAGSTPGRAADIRWATRNAAPSTRARSTMDGGTSSRISRRRLVFFAQAGIAVEYRQRDKGPALMADRAEISVGDEIERLLAAVVGMHPPADVRQQAGGVAQPAVFLGFRATSRPGPGDRSSRSIPRAWRADRDNSSLRFCAAQIKPSLARSACGSIS